MTKPTQFLEGWLALMSTEMAVRYLLLIEVALNQLLLRYAALAVEIEETDLR